MRLLKKAGGAVHNIIGIASLLAKFGVDVCIIADSESCRPQTKRASVERAANREHERSLGLKAREELATLLQSENPPKEKIKELQKTIQSKERATYNTLPDFFVESLRGRVDDLRNSSQVTGKITFVVAERQADPLLARRLIHNGSVEMTNERNSERT
jgi:hypothetical protein